MLCHGGAVIDPHAAILAGLTAAQAEAATHDGAILVLAGAGTGKTRTLISAVAWRIARQGITPNRILAVAFSNKAASEMTARLRAMLAGQPLPSWVGTFHGLAARQLRTEPEIAGLRGGFEIVDADDSRRMVRRTLAATQAGDEGAGNEGRDKQWPKLDNSIGRKQRTETRNRMNLEFASGLFSENISEKPNTRKWDSKKTSEQEWLPRSVAVRQGFGLRPAARPCPAATAAPAE